MLQPWETMKKTIKKRIAWIDNALASDLSTPAFVCAHKKVRYLTADFICDHVIHDLCCPYTIHRLKINIYPARDLAFKSTPLTYSNI